MLRVKIRTTIIRLVIGLIRLDLLSGTKYQYWKLPKKFSVVFSTENLILTLAENYQKQVGCLFSPTEFTKLQIS